MDPFPIVVGPSTLIRIRPVVSGLCESERNMDGGSIESEIEPAAWDEAASEFRYPPVSPANCSKGNPRSAEGRALN